MEVCWTLEVIVTVLWPQNSFSFSFSFYFENGEVILVEAKNLDAKPSSYEEANESYEKAMNYIDYI